jgi:outer membrane protein OmpA-like peptidoglycan-associated protein
MRMSVQDDDVQGFALAAVLGVVALVVTGVLVLACARVLNRPVDNGPATPGERVYFDAGSDSLSAEANDVLERVAQAVRQTDQPMVLITGVRAYRGDPAEAHKRALRVRHALESNGIAASRLVLAQPLALPPRGSAKEARRVDVWVQ